MSTDMFDMSLRRNNPSLALASLLASVLLMLACGNTSFSSSGRRLADSNDAGKNTGKSSGGDDSNDSSSPGKGGSKNGGKDDGTDGDDDGSSNLGVDDDEDSSGDDDDLLESDDDQIALVALPLDFQRFPDTAANDNCLFMIINKQPEQKFGCNHSGGAQNTITAMVKPKPYCNTIRLRLTSNNVQSWTTANASDISTFFRISKPAANVIKLQANDNRDNDFNDLNLTISGRDKIKFTIENSGQGCD